MRLLHVEASPMNAASTSTEIASAFLESYRASHPQDAIDSVDVWSADLPPFDADMIGAKFAVLRSQTATPEQRSRWESALAFARRFDAADKYLFSVPMWNFGIPYRLKHFIDVVTLPGENWTWSPEEGFRPLHPAKRAALVYSSAGAYPLRPDEDPSDFQKPYLRRWLAFLGVEDVYEITAGPTLAPPEQRAQDRAVAVERARALARRF